MKKIVFVSVAILVLTVGAFGTYKFIANKRLQDALKQADEQFNRAQDAYRNGNHDSEYYTATIALYDKVIALNSSISGAYFNRGVAKLKIPDASGALEDFNKVIELDANNAQAYFNRATAKYNLNDLDGDLADSIKAHQINPNDAAILDGCCSAYLDHGKYNSEHNGNNDSVASDYLQALALEPSNAVVYVYMADCACDQEKYQLALQLYATAIALHPIPIAYYNRAFNMTSTADIGVVIEGGECVTVGSQYGYSLSSAIDDLNKALDLVSDKPGPSDDLAFLGDRAENFPKRATVDSTNITSELANKYFERGYLDKYKNKLEEAAADYAEGFKYDDSNFRAWANLGDVESLLNDFTSAVNAYNKAIQLAPQQDDYRYAALRGRAKIEQSQNDLQNALNDFNQALEIHPDNINLQQTIANLKSQLGQ